MTKLQIDRNREFLKDLRKNRKKATGQLHDGHGAHCCLGVACNTAERLGLVFKTRDADAVPPQTVVKFFGWEDENPSLNVPGINWRVAAAGLNDSDGTGLLPRCSHKRIADLFEATYPELKP